MGSCYRNETYELNLCKTIVDEGEAPANTTRKMRFNTRMNERVCMLDVADNSM